MEAGHFRSQKPLNRVWMRLTILRPLLLTGNTDTVFITAWLELKTGGS
jgi:hypothetical protein